MGDDGDTGPVFRRKDLGEGDWKGNFRPPFFFVTKLKQFLYWIMITSEDVLRIAGRVSATFEGVSEEEARSLVSAPVDALQEGAARITGKCASKVFDTCSIINARSGRCPEDCKWCAQSARHRSVVPEYGLVGVDKLVEAAGFSKEKGIRRFSIVTSGRKLGDAEVEQVCSAVRELASRVDISLCISAGLLSARSMAALAEAGITRYHCNLETAPSYFGELCTTHSVEDKIRTLEAAREAGLEICSGGIIGMGETMEQRIELAILLRSLGVKSVPVNILAPIKGTPLEDVPLMGEDEILRTIAIFRFILPDAALRFAGGRARLSEEAVLTAYRIGINASIMGDMLTTAGADIDTDMERIHSYYVTD